MGREQVAGPVPQLYLPGRVGQPGGDREEAFVAAAQVLDLLVERPAGAVQDALLAGLGARVLGDVHAGAGRLQQVDQESALRDRWARTCPRVQPGRADGSRTASGFSSATVWNSCSALSSTRRRVSAAVRAAVVSVMGVSASVWCVDR